MRVATFVVASLFAVIAVAPAAAAPEAKGGTFPGKGNGLDGVPGNTGASGTFPGGGATEGTFPGGGKGVTGNAGGGGGTVSASEPFNLVLTAVGLLGASMVLLRRRQ